MAGTGSILPDIFHRLGTENLLATFLAAAATTSTPSHPSTSPAQPNGDRDSWILLDGEPSDPANDDSKDPRWAELFLEYFVVGGAEGNDDLLFFVKQLPLQQTSQGYYVPPAGGAAPAEDPILVRRKVGKQMPALDHLVDWKQTFFLNLIVQLPCTLTVAVCKRGMPGSQTSFSAGNGAATPSGTNGPMYASPTTSGTPTVTTTNDANTTTSSPPSTTIEYPTPTPPNKPPKSKMLAIQRISKTVYAAPYKSRMDVKDAFMNECSFPLVYYTVNDYESHDLHLSIRQNEYLCVELSVMLPDPQAPGDSNVWTSSRGTDAVGNISVTDDPAPFPVPPKCVKTVLFQGAVPYTSLLDIFQQKGLAARNHMRFGGWKRDSGGAGHDMAPGGGNNSSATSLSERTEYIMMRGPRGKGQCQVAIKDDPVVESTINLNTLSSPTSTTPTTPLPTPSAPQPVPTPPLSYPSSPSSSSSHLPPSATLGASPSNTTSNISTSPSPRKQPTLSDRLLRFGNTVRSQIVAAAASAGIDSGNGVDSGGPGTGEGKVVSLRCSMTYVNVPWISIISDLAAADFAKVPPPPVPAPE
ncbi:uncharacterized protein EV422DRAFT_563825 [Fimicolochytrium jonesii]|uniref:uncharacterized protein n=1 Tax=Fimicolochytrium jonesii TaxID=1396493 RepID=UPI0022FDC851|nr:uncharacterized protein EV422DRAFT_563825 [Fimicolochytrium jonesii]KAI8826010.1 hypothetical protein EV422DRAFT_563825 [Fimicolochytrium jonesii]